MRNRNLRIEALLGRKVCDVNGKSAGRIEELEAEQVGDDCFVKIYVLGAQGLRERLSVTGVGMLFLRPLGARSNTGSRRVPWQQMDLTDPLHPRLRCTVSELDEMQDNVKGRK
jgi:hypothetical protein